MPCTSRIGRWVGVRAFWFTMAAAALAACSDNATNPLDLAADLSRQAVGSVTVSPGSASGTVGQSAQFTATVYDRSGTVINKAVAWSSSDSTVVTVSANGYATAVGVGSARVIATAGAKSGYASATVAGVPVASITVSPGTLSGSVGDSAPLTATLFDANGTVLTGRPVVWASSDTAVAVVSAGGMAKGMGAGSATLTATSGGVAGTAAVTVTGVTQTVPVAAVAVSPGSASGSVGDSGQFTATVTDASGNVLTDRAVSWTSSNTAVVTVSATGMAHAVGGGSATLTATSEGKSGQATVSVSGGAGGTGAPASVVVAPGTASIGVAGAQQLSATVRDASGNTLSGQTVAWSSSNVLVAPVSATGLVTGLLAGTATITATSGGVSGAAVITVTVLPPPPTGSWPNAPSGLNLISDQPFNLLDDLGWAHIWDNGGNGSIVSDANAPFSASNVLQIRYPAGFTGGSAPATEVRDFAPTSQVYTGLWVKVSSPWQGHSSNVNKIQFLYADNSGGDLTMVMYGPPGGPYNLRVEREIAGQTVIWYTPNVGDGTFALGTWHRVEWFVDNGSGPGTATLRFWLDGRLVGDYSGTTLASSGWIEHQISPTWGGVNETKQETDYLWIDHAIIKGH